jgi:hypothetical protein
MEKIELPLPFLRNAIEFGKLEHYIVLKNLDLFKENLTEKTIKLLSQLCRKKLLICDNEGEYKLSEEGRKYIAKCEGNTTKKKKTYEKEMFEEWWKTYPSTDCFTVDGRVFTGSRSLRLKKNDCMVLFFKALEEGYTKEEMIAALKREVELKMKMSVQQNRNNLTFMKNTHSYLNQQAYVPFIEMIRNQKPSENEKRVEQFWGHIIE